MNKLQTLREARNAKARAAHDLNAKYPAEQAMPADESTKLDALLNEVTAIDAAIEREQRVMALEAEQNPQAALDALRDAATRSPGAHSERSSALRAFLTGGLRALSAEQVTEMSARVNPDIRAAMSTTTNSEGGYTTAIEYQRSLEEAMKAFGGIRSVATVIRTATGTQMQFPAADATAEEGEIVGQNTAVSALDTTFSNLTIDVFKYSSKKIALPFELVQDSFIDIEAYIQGLLAMRLGRITAKHFTTGTGTGQPRGLITAASVGVIGATGTATTFGYDDLVNLEHSVDPAYRSAPGVGFMMSDAALRVARKIKDSNGRPVFVPGYEQGNPGGAPDRLLGRPIYLSQEMAAPAANAKSIAFGQFGKYVIRDVMDMTLFRMTDSAFTLNGQIGFVAFMRSGGNLIDVGGAVKTFQHSAT